MGILDRVLRAGEGKKLKALAGLVPDINALDADMRALSDGQLQAKTAEFRQRLANGEDLDDLLLEAFAVMREAADRVIGQRHYDVQLMGGAALHFGWVAEMKTGEGKTLVSTLPAYLNGLSGEGMHLVTVNDYLARRDAEWMGRIHRWLGLNVGLILPNNATAEEKRSNTADITTAQTTVGFDYLRDNMAIQATEKGQRGHVYATWTRSTRSSSTRPAPPPSSRPCRRCRQALLQVRLDRAFASSGRGLRGRRGKANRCPARIGHRQVEAASAGEPI